MSFAEVPVGFQSVLFIRFYPEGQSGAKKSPPDGQKGLYYVEYRQALNLTYLPPFERGWNWHLITHSAHRLPRLHWAITLCLSG